MVTERREQLQLLDQLVVLQLQLGEKQLELASVQLQQLFPAPCSAVAELVTWLGTLLPSTAQDETVVSPKNLQQNYLLIMI